MLLRRWNLVRRHYLDVQRSCLTANMQEHRQNPIGHVTGVADLAAKLRQNAVDDHQMIYRGSWAFYYGVSRCFTASPSYLWAPL